MASWCVTVRPWTVGPGYPPGRTHHQECRHAPHPAV